jgi:hypothetical protein
MRDKRKLTEALIAQLPAQYQVTVDEALRTWWHNFRNAGGLRLTRHGYDVFTDQLDIERYEYHIDPLTINARMIIALDRKLQQPWYITFQKKVPQSIVFFGSREAMMANLYGDLKKFLDNY